MLKKLFSSSTPFSLVHSDVWGPAPVASLFGFCYFVIFIDDYFRAIWIYLLKLQSGIFLVFQLFHKLVKTQFDTKVKVLRSNNGGEYMSNAFTSYLS